LLNNYLFSEFNGLPDFLARSSLIAMNPYHSAGVYPRGRSFVAVANCGAGANGWHHRGRSGVLLL
jgi:hypothetical protein